MTEHEKRIREALEAGPTEGPFITFNDQVYRATDPDLTAPVASWNTAGFTMEGVSIDALYYAACNPAAIRALLADLDAVRGALERVDADWSSFWPLGPDVTSSSDRVCAIAPETAEIWRAIRAALKGATA